MKTTQKEFARKYQNRINAFLGLLKDNHNRELMSEWRACRRDLITGIIHAYKMAAPRGRWNILSYRSSGVEGALRAFLQRRLATFRASTTVNMRAAFSDIRKQSALRHGWLLDQLTPESFPVKVPPSALHEAARGGDPEIWVDRWGQWVEAYENNLYHNVTMHAMNEGSLEGAVDEVDATKMNTPSASMETAFSRLLEFKSYEAIADGEDEIAQLNDHLIQEEIWMTSGRANVCDECQDNEGKTADEVQGDIPLHPKCDCFWEIHPKSYIDLLRSGDAGDRELAAQMERDGLDGGSLVVRSKDGEVAARVVLSFNTWQNGLMGYLMGGTR